jgi:hypothetical protein
MTEQTGWRTRRGVRGQAGRFVGGAPQPPRPPLVTWINRSDDLPRHDLAVLREVLARADGRSDLTRVADFRGGVWA